MTNQLFTCKSLKKMFSYQEDSVTTPHLRAILFILFNYIANISLFPQLNSGLFLKDHKFKIILTVGRIIVTTKLVLLQMTMTWTFSFCPPDPLCPLSHSAPCPWNGPLWTTISGCFALCFPVGSDQREALNKQEMGGREGWKGWRWGRQSGITGCSPSSLTLEWSWQWWFQEVSLLASLSQAFSLQTFFLHNSLAIR